ncbi:hypothetical protein [Sphingomonas sp.]|uniref:hypothetical protein n=1 Tax=Sphingomonas sp. TaxID=28214 RepID=UPI003CC51E51
MLLALLLQATPAATTPVTPVTSVSAAPPSRFSILADRCAPVQQDGHDVVVCGESTATTQRLPYRDEIVPDGPVPSNPLVNGRGALAAEGTPCAALMSGCQVGVGPPLVPMIAAAVNGIRNASANRREARARAADGDRRRPIDLNATGPAGHLEP